MRKLQNNYTTPEQSKKLLKLGVPADSADCIYYGKGLSPSTLLGYNGNQFLYSEIKESEDCIPCWSVGRLIEILEIILGSPWSDKELLGEQGTLLERVVSDFEDVVKYKEIFKDNRIDFSKLED